ncbi:NAD+ synthase [Hydromonas duriensis]|uniref:Glutamine-dependent NAD(+) synthetase n=1 Tax=Hydromonas duriensis TaxID=1527608 RepID=A0A4R6Y8J1_9BURK|nr:NAD+ synthase [Hydromonas duriensis]TDR31716.1 NAD+ synthase (glutamine-hydrolysing) [Hydromonas duriensis]
MLKISTAQIPARIGDFSFNVEHIVRAAANAQQQGAHVLVTPELSLTGYIPEDLLLRPAYRAACEKVFNDVCEALTQYPDLYVLIGLPTWFEDGVKLRSFNSVVVLLGGVEVQRVHKQKLPNQAVFDELRYFSVGPEPDVIEIQGVKVGVLVCEDAWHAQPALALKAKGAELLLIPNASPFHVNKMDKRYAVLRNRAKETGLPLLYVNRTGGQDELVFDGGSCAMNSDGELRSQMPLFTDVLNEVVFDIEQKSFHKDMQMNMPAAEEQVYRALVHGVKDYVAATGFKKVVLGLSGGVDSALTLAVAVDALGAEHVHAIMMPTRYTAQMSLDDAQEMAQRVGVKYDVVAIEEMFNLYVQTLAPVFGDKPADVTEENLQARIRGVILMAVSNKHGALVLNTGNKSELATGYCTLYGDMVGAFAVLKDVYKTQVYNVCDWRNSTDAYAIRSPIPTNIITRAPSAELRDNQKDQDSLPPYEVLDDILERYIEQRQPIKTIVAAGHDEATVQRIARLIRINEYKRRQGALGPRVTTLGFGKDWRMPIMNGFAE